MEFFWLLFAHFLADLPLQGEFIAKNKGKEPLFMIGHCVIWAGCIALTLQMLGIEMSIWKWTFLFCGHYLADSFKCKVVEIEDIFNRPLKLTKRQYVYLDQLIHLSQLLCVYFL